MLIIDDVEYDEDSLSDHTKMMCDRMNSLKVDAQEHQMLLDELQALINIYQNSIKEAVEVSTES
tara:strand:- start:34 stop:225 length:192 start_codon:yes stop_codon:yes gene_type:complete